MRQAEIIDKTIQTRNSWYIVASIVTDSTKINSLGIHQKAKYNKTQSEEKVEHLHPKWKHRKKATMKNGW